MTHPFKASLLTGGVLLALLSGLGADGRSFVWTYQYQTMPRGTAEMEYYTTFTSPLSPSMGGATSVFHELVLQIGMNDYFDIGLFQRFSQVPGGSFTYDGFKVRARKRFAEQGQFIVDPLLYLEYKGVPDFSTHEFEAKLILAKTAGKIEWAVNPQIGIERKAGETEVAWAYTAGINYDWGPIFRSGLEMKGSAGGHYLGPVISHGKEEFWVALGVLRAMTGVTAGKPRIMIRLIVGVGL